MLESKGHKDLVRMTSDPVLVNVVVKQNEDVWAAADKLRDSRASAAVY